MPQALETRDRILVTARALFHQKGYAAVGVADICQQAGVVKGSFYHFFPSKAELLTEVLQLNWQAVESALLKLEQAAGPARGKIEQFLAIIVGHGRKMHEQCEKIYGCPIGVVASEIAPGGVLADARVPEILGSWKALMQRLVEAGQTDGSIAATVPAEAIAAALLASVQGMSVLGRTFHDPEMLRVIAERAMFQVPQPET